MKSVLIVDDHPVIRGALKIVLKQEGYKRIYEAASGNEVLPMIRKHRPELVVLDLNIPSLDGLDVLARIKGGEVPCRIVVFTSQEPEFFQTGACVQGPLPSSPRPMTCSICIKPCTR
jgi:two-component system response regulator EvgA